MRVLSIGEIIWDLFPDAEHLGGAPLNFAAHCRRLGHDAYLLSAVGDDARGPRAIQRIAELRVAVDFIHRVKGLPTGIAAVECDAEGKPYFAVGRPAAYDRLQISDETLTRIADLQPDWIYFGTLFHTNPENLALTRRIIEACPTAYRVFDMNLRGEHWNTELVMELISMSHVVKASEEEIQLLHKPVVIASQATIAEEFKKFGVDLQRIQAKVVVITRGREGCIVRSAEGFAIQKGFPVQVADTVGAGDAFTAAFIHALSEQIPLGEAARFANAVGALVASRPGAIPEWRLNEVEALLRSEA